jgi:hypothetical protein
MSPNEIFLQTPSVSLGHHSTPIPDTGTSPSPSINLAYGSWNIPRATMPQDLFGYYLLLQMTLEASINVETKRQ